MPGGKNGKRKAGAAVLGFPRGPDPTSIKLYRCSICLGDWKYEFCFGSGRTIFIRTDDEDKVPTLRLMMSRPSSLEETLMPGKIVGRRRQMRVFDGITYSKDMSLRKLQGTVKAKEACFVAEHVITKSQTWLSN